MPFPSSPGAAAPIFASVRHTFWSDLAKQIQTYRDAWQEAGDPGRGPVFVSAPTYIAETEERAVAEPKESIMHFYHDASPPGLSEPASARTYP